MHSLDEGGDVSAFGFCAAERVLGGPTVPFLLLGQRFWVIALWSSRDALDIPFRTLLVESIEFEAVCWRWPSGACAWNAFYNLESVNEDAVYACQWCFWIGGEDVEIESNQLAYLQHPCCKGREGKKSQFRILGV